MELEKDIEEIEASEVLETAIKSEIESQRTYKKLKNSDISPEAKERIQEILEQEENHEEKLRKLYKDWYPDKEPQLPDEDVNIEGRIEEMPSDPEKLLEASIQDESEAEETYSKLSEKVENETESKTFKHLAYIERQHRNALKDELNKINLQEENSDSPNSDG